MTRRTPQIPALRTPPLDRDREPAGRFATRDAAGRLALLLLLLVAGSARANTFYIDYATGSNSNAGTKVSPWKTHPYMQTGSACTGGVTGWGGWTHAAGDHYIFKGGVTWPAACFGLFISAGGSSESSVSGAGAAPTINGADYYGVDVTWYSGGSFTRPVFDMAGTTPAGTNGATITVSANNVTLDDIEIAHSLLVYGLATCSFGNINLGTTSTVVIDRMYIHDWTIASMAQFDGGWHSQAGICSNVGANYSDAVYNTEMSDKNTTAAFPFGSCFIALGEVAYNNCHDVGEGGLFDEGNFHDNQIHDLDGSPAYAASGIHDNGFESDGWPPPFYNNLMYNLNVHYNVLCFSARGTYFYNNVIYASKVADMAFDTSPGDGCQSSNSNLSYAYNNTLEANGTYYGGGAHASIRIVGSVSRPGTLTGVVTLENNISIGNGFDLSQTTSTPVQPNNYVMGTSEASTYGLTSSNKLKPSSSDPNVTGQGANLTPSCSGNLAALCQDASGAPWFGGAYITRPTGSTGWDLGAFQGQGGSTGPPTISISSPSPGPVSGSVNLTATCTPVSPATCTSVQYTIDGFSFGAAQTVSPYTLSWNTATAANATHVIGATATDSNGQTGTASTVTVTVSNSMPGCFVSRDNGSGSLSWTANQSFTAQSVNFGATFTATPNTANQDTVIALSQSPMTAYSQGAALIRFNSSGNIDVYKGSIANYAADATVSYAAGTTYAFAFTVNMTAGTYTVALTSPSSVTLATNYSFRTTAPAGSLGFLNAVSDDTTPDTSQVCGFALAGSTSLTFSPASLNFGSITVGANGTQPITATTTGGSVNFTSVAISGNADFTIDSNTCAGSVPSSCATQIKFAPTSAALETATVTYTDDATGSPQTVAVSGTGVPATPTLSVNPTSLNFGGVQVHTTSSNGPIVLTISSGPVTFTGTPSLSGASAADFALASNTCTGSVSAASCQTVVSFTPSLVAAESATLTYTDNATGSPQSVALTGTGYLAPHPPTAVHAAVQ